MNLRPLIWLAVLACGTLQAQWLDHYPHVDGYRHHIYLEGYDLPSVAHGPLDPAPAPDGRSLYFAAMGWLWKLDLGSGSAARLTRGGPCDSRPSVSPDGQRLVFLRDDGRTIRIVLKDLAGGAERDLVRSGMIDLDPVFAADGRSVLYASSEGGGMDLWRVEVEGGRKQRLTTEAGMELKPQPSPDGRQVLYLSKVPQGEDRVVWLDLETGARQVLQSGPILSMTRPALARDGHSVALALPLPDSDRYQLYAMDVRETGHHLQVLTPPGRPLNPAWSPDGRWVYFSEEEAGHAFVLKRASVLGGRVETVPIKAWDWGVPTTTLRVRTLAGATPVPARLEVTDGQGHPLFPPGVPLRFDNQHGRTYFHLPGEAAWTVPAGAVQVNACRGLASRVTTRTLQAQAGTPAQVDLPIDTVATPRLQGWYSGDIHFHLNYGGLHQLDPEDLVQIMRGEDLDLAIPMAANLRTRLVGTEHLGWRKADAPPLVEFGQEVRSNFLGHVGLAHINGTFQPWFWGPDFPLTRGWDVLNEDVLRFARRTGAFSSYVHPTAARDPFDPAAKNAIPLSLVADAVLGLVDGFEISGLWVHELGAAEIYYRLLNTGATLVPLGATDAFPNFYRCSVVGSNRTFVQVDGPLTLAAFFENLRKGRSFVSSGPLVDFRVEGRLPGAVVAGGTVAWTLDLASALPVTHLEILVNGKVVQTLEPLAAAGRTARSGRVTLPAGGWVAFRAWDDRSAWPSMSSRTFAHSAPHWIGRAGSTEPAPAKAAALDLLKVLEGAEKTAAGSLSPEQMVRLRAQFAAARAVLDPLAR